MSNGLKGKVKQLTQEMNARRSNPERPEDIGLREHLARNYSGLTPGHLFADLQIDPRYTTIKQLMADPDLAHLVPELIRQGIVRGMGQTRAEALASVRQLVANGSPIFSESGTENRWISPEVWLDPVMRDLLQVGYYQDLIVADEPVASDTVKIPNFTLSDTGMDETGEGETVREGTVEYGHKTVTIKARTKGIKMTYESIMFNSMNLVGHFFEQLGRRLALRLSADAVDVVINGDQADGSEAAPVIGVTTAGQYKYKDFQRIGIRFNLLGHVGQVAIGNEESCLDYLDLEDVKQKQFAGSPLLPVRFKSAVQTPEDLYASHKVATDRLVVADRTATLIKLTAQPLMLETEKIIAKRLQHSVVSLITGFAKLQRTSAVVLRKDLAFSAAGWPAWMTPVAD